MIATNPRHGTARIVAVAYALPSRQVTNAELSLAHPEWKVPRAAKHTGVDTRHWASEGETALDLATTACRRIEEQHPGSLERCDIILFCTQTPNYLMPANASLLQDRLGLPTTVGGVDYSQGCAGFTYGLQLAKGMLEAGMVQQVLLVTADTTSRLMDPADRGTVLLFGDGAAAAILRADGDDPMTVSVGSDGSRGMALYATARTPVVMHGADILDFAKNDVPRVIQAHLDHFGDHLDAIDLVVLHQASNLALDYIYQALDVPADKRFSNLARVGNLVAASIPVALHDAECAGRLKPGMRVLMAGYGAGLSWGIAVTRWSAQQ